MSGILSPIFWAIMCPSTSTVSSPFEPLMTLTCTSRSFRRAAAKLAANSRIELQTGHWRMVTFFIADAPFRIGK